MIFKISKTIQEALDRLVLRLDDFLRIVTPFSKATDSFFASFKQYFFYESKAIYDILINIEKQTRNPEKLTDSIFEQTNKIQLFNTTEILISNINNDRKSIVDSLRNTSSSISDVLQSISSGKAIGSIGAEAVNSLVNNLPSINETIHTVNELLNKSSNIAEQIAKGQFVENLKKNFEDEISSYNILAGNYNKLAITVDGYMPYVMISMIAFFAIGSFAMLGCCAAYSYKTYNDIKERKKYKFYDASLLSSEHLILENK